MSNTSPAIQGGGGGNLNKAGAQDSYLQLKDSYPKGQDSYPKVRRAG